MSYCLKTIDFEIRVFPKDFKKQHRFWGINRADKNYSYLTLVEGFPASLELQYRQRCGENVPKNACAVGGISISKEAVKDAVAGGFKRFLIRYDKEDSPDKQRRVDLAIGRSIKLITNLGYEAKAGEYYNG